MISLMEYYEKNIKNKEKVIDSPFDDPRTEEEKICESTLYTGCSATCIHPACPLWDKEHSRRLFDLD